MSDEKLPVGDCPNCGVIADDAVNWNFPAVATCDLCGAELDRASMATEAKIARYA